MRTYRLLLAGALSAVTTLAAVAVPALPARAATPPLCSDGLDDDADGFTDYPADPGCSGPTDSSERGSTTCDNGVDDDRDGVADAPLDAGCAGPGDGNELRGTGCDDGVDNDADGRTDFPADTGCASPGDPVESDECAEPATVLVCPTVGAVIHDQVVPTPVVAPGEHRPVRGYVDGYVVRTPSGTGSHVIPCVVLVTDVLGELNPCAAAGLQFDSRRLTLLDANPQEVDVTTGAGPRLRLCHATYEVKVLGFGPEALPGVSLC